MHSDSPSTGETRRRLREALGSIGNCELSTQVRALCFGFLTPSLRSRSSRRGRRRGTQDHSEQLVIAEFNPSETQDPTEKESRPPTAAPARRRQPPPPAAAQSVPASTAPFVRARVDHAVSRLSHFQVSVNCVTGPDPAKPQVALTVACVCARAQAGVCALKVWCLCACVRLRVCLRAHVRVCVRA